MSKNYYIEYDEWGRPVVYLAQWKNNRSGGTAVFTRPESAIFYVMSMIGSLVDWNSFPNPDLHYPYEERNGDNRGLNPLFVVKRMQFDGTEIEASVTRMGAMLDWSVGNGIGNWCVERVPEITNYNCIPEPTEGNGAKV